MLKILLPALLFSSSLHAGWMERKAEGWAWYEDRLEEETKEEEKKENIESLSATKQMEKFQEDLKEALSKSVLYPTKENIKEYIVLQNNVLNRSSLYAENWKKVLLENPELSQLSKTPASHYGIQLNKFLEAQKKEQLITYLSKEHGLVFFYEGKDPMSKAFSKIVNLFSEKYQWAVLAISLDDSLLPIFPDSKKDNGISQAFNVKSSPSLFAVNPETNVVTPISFGVVSVDQIEENIFLQFKENPDAT